jgi:alkylhydroperoxidase/carboxymuconolactone decarboxylase family protein YurZ
MDKLAELAPGLSDGFKTMRDGVFAAGPLSRHTIELIVVASLVATRGHQSLRVHVRRLLADGVDPAELRQAVVATLGASATLAEVIEALDIVESEIAQRDR